MKTWKWIFVSVFSVIGVLALTGVLFANAASIQRPPQVEPALQSVLQAQGTANLFVEFSAKADLSSANSMTWSERGDYVYRNLQTTADRSQAKVREFLDARGIPFKFFIINNSIYIPNASQELLDELAGFNGINRFYLEEIFAVPDIQPVTQDEAIQAVEWGVGKINADDAWALGYNGTGLVVANIDTGVRYTHTALNNKYRGKNGDGTYTHTYSWYDPTGTYGSTPGDNNGHGTHTAGTMVGDDGSANQVGVAPGAKWIACKGCSSSSCASNHLLACFDWMLAPGGNSSLRPNVVNNSWGGCSYSNTYETAVNNLRSSGIHPVFSAGNASNCGYSAPFCGSVGSPGTYKGVTAVGSTTSTDTISSFSLWGPSTDPTGGNEIKPEISAPGSSVRSSYNSSDTSYTSMSGTSMAAPHVAGALAVIWDACPALIGNFDASEQLLKDTALKIAYNSSCGNEGPGNIPNNAFGYGRIDVLAAINSCLGGPLPTATNTPVVTATFTPVFTATYTAVPTATYTPVPSGVLHIADLDNVSTKTRQRWNARIEITVHNANHTAVSGVVVTGSWSAGATGTASCTTGTNGKCTVSKSNLTVSSVTFTVTNATKSGNTYNSSANHDPDGGNGTVIVVNRP